MPEAKTTAEVLRAARKLIEDPERWTQGTYHECNGDEKWCAVGALLKASHAPEYTSAYLPRSFWEIFQRVKPRGGIDWLLRVNDGQGHPEVLAAFDRAIELAEAKA